MFSEKSIRKDVQSFAEAISIRGGIFIYIDTNESINSPIGAETLTESLHG